MTELLAALLDPDLPFLRYALITGLLASVSFGIIGTFVVVRRISYIAGAISHCVLAGIGGGLYLQNVVGIPWITPVRGAAIVALLAALILARVSKKTGQREDSIIGALWAGGMSIGFLFIAATPGYFDPMSYLFGNILLISKEDIYFVILLDLVILSVVGIFYNKLVALCFDEEYTQLRGVHTRWLYLLLLCLTALTIVLLVRIVGIIMVIALLTLPAAIAGNLASGIRQMMGLAVLLSSLFIVSGLGVSFSFDLPSGSVIILIATICYLLSLKITAKHRRKQEKTSCSDKYSQEKT
ncbi:MAG: metal ABC transporter permease [Candidatus Electrothrix aestuarii]|uniref:Metal ABC transporter permease n=1 Tax=Candidatus Electrothrix aestuarii TaxID=3062594 RepID=A0AAU8LQ19_9BACT|nr:metal ABC transporter permease [Candidatus Electrothrix aestuarii]WPD24680.1 MAG: metal ABC transporter permease [Candidatus Electrothrix sp. GW3-3]